MVARREWPPHFRTLWYAELRDGTTRRVKLDVAEVTVARLPVIANTPDENPFAGKDEFELPAVVVVNTDEGPWVLDGKHVVAAMRQREKTEQVQTIGLPDLENAMVDALRTRVRDGK
jgi:hypothetical protein